MTPEEYRIYERKYRSIQDLKIETDLDSLVHLQDVTFRVFTGEPGYERLWEEQTRARIARQRTLARLPRHAG